MGKSIYRSHRRYWNIHRFNVLRWLILRRGLKQMDKNKIKFDEFKAYVVEHFQNEYSNHQIIMRVVDKNNEKLTGIFVKSNQAIVPIIYIDDYYNKYNNGKSLEDIIGKMVSDYDEKMNAAQDVSFDVSKVSDYVYVCDKIYCKLVSLSNTDYLKDKEYIIHEDLAEVFYIQIEISGCSGDIQITKDLARKWGTSAEVLHNIAMNNMKLFLFDDLIECIKSKLTGTDSAGISDNSSVFILSNDKQAYGASVVLNNDIMDKVHDAVGVDKIYVLPSSVHEMILCKDTNLSLNDLMDMVRTVNDTELTPRDKLSDNVYKYDFNSHKLYIASNEQQRQVEQNNMNMHHVSR